ncbi:MAG: BspA family leucine-rich repeat surface protein, partial [Gammaproteobacteria bacterium]|nr:BspA family leucine-rich repeat surface protein [Gammaproteobacteria bacterium]
VTESEWALASTDPEWVCRIDGDPYEYADFHILTTIDSQPDVCATQDTLPTDENNGQGVFCAQKDSTVRAIYDWNNAASYKLTWLSSVEQIGSRLEDGVVCGAAGRTTAGRCANQLKSGVKAFREMKGIGGSGIRALDVSNLTDMAYMFQGAKSFNEDLTQWTTGNVKNMPYVFQNAQAFNQPLPWDTSKVEVMSYMFDKAYKFDQPLSDWETTSVRLMRGMFQSAEDFNQDLSAWANKLTQLQNMENMFKNASAFNNGSAPGASDQPLNWTAPNLGLMNYAFAYATSFNQQIFADGASTTNVTNMSGMFKGATAFNQHIGGWNTQSLDKAASMFEDATAFNKDIGNWSMGVVTNMNAMFKNAEAFNQDLSGWVLGKRAID